jgi:hypothetical protein
MKIDIRGGGIEPMFTFDGLPGEKGIEIDLPDEEWEDYRVTLDKYIAWQHKLQKLAKKDML